ncbi:unnamed protein product [Moneuplotes crassus]|uniref:histidine kinase n=1 Tax=Euplotes crassus TaxID=5936 RepID=A0AAD2DB64_EUPCR|nr:unnamed protein product [Moneuplotes crassus]
MAMVIWQEYISKNFVVRELRSCWIFNDIDFGDDRIEKMYQEHRLKAIRNNWKFILLILKIMYALIAIVFQINSDDGIRLKRLGPVLMLCLLHLLKYYIYRNKFVARYGAILLILGLGTIMVAVNIQFEQFRLHEGFLFHISMSFLLSTCLSSDWKVFSAAIALVYCNLYIMLWIKFTNVPIIITHVLVFSLAIFCFNAFLISRTLRQEFFATHNAKQASAQLKRVLEELPEGVIITDESKNELKFINKKLKKTFDMSAFHQPCKESIELARINESVLKSFDQILEKVAEDLGSEESLFMINKILSHFTVKVKKDKIEENKGNEQDDESDEYQEVSLPNFLVDERKRLKVLLCNEINSKVSISYEHKEICERIEFLQRDFILVTSRIDLVDDKYLKPTFFQMCIDTTQITQLEEAKAQSRYQRQMLSNVSHEFRTPLNAMSLSLYLMRYHINEDCLKFHQISSSSCDILKGLVEDILDFSKIEAGVFEIEEREFTFNQLFSEVSSIFEIQTRMKGILLNFQMEAVFEELKMKSDKQRIKQILLNLVSNALKFTDHGSINVHLKIQEIRRINAEENKEDEFNKALSCEALEEMPVCNLLLGTNRYKFEYHCSKFYEEIVDLHREDKTTGKLLQKQEQEPLPSEFMKDLNVELSVTDTGIGIPERDLPSLFKLFGKTSSNHNRNKTGTGLGLTICKKLCEKLGGKIELESKERVGTKVTCSFICHY